MLHEVKRSTAINHNDYIFTHNTFMCKHCEDKTTSLYIYIGAKGADLFFIVINENGSYNRLAIKETDTYNDLFFDDDELYLVDNNSIDFVNVNYSLK